MESVIELPFNRFVGLELAAEPESLLRLPDSSQYLNHLGTVHASALLALAEASSGEYLLRALRPESGVVPVVRHLEAKFRKPAHGAVSSSVSVAADAIDKLRAALATKGRALITVAVELRDASGTHALSASVEWFMTKLPAQASE